MPAYPRTVAFGEGALLVEFGDAPERAANLAAHALANVLEQDPPPGLQALVPGYASLLVLYDPHARGVRLSVERGLMRDLAAPSPHSTPARLRRVPVVYGGPYGPDLQDVAERTGLTSDEVVAQHVRDEQRVYMLGFAPGHPYLGDLPPAFAAIPRLDTPRSRVRRGAVGVVGRQSVIYPHSTPGGWRIVGQTPIVLWNERRDPPAYFAPGDRVQFQQIAVADWQEHSGEPADW